MAVKGDLKLEIDEQGIEVRITITPDDNGADISPETIQAMLAEKKVRAGIDANAVDAAFRTLARKKTDPVSFIAASGTPPQPGAPESVDFEQLPIPERLAAVARSILDAAPRPRGFRMREERVKVEKKVLKKPALPFLPAREMIETVVEKRVVREEVKIDPAVTGTGFAIQGSLVARVRPGKQGKEGRSVFGRLVPAPRPAQAGFLFCDGLTRAGAEVKADVTGFLRRGAHWSDVVPFRDHSMEVTASRDGLSCLFSFMPGDPAAPAPDPAEILARAGKLGFNAQSLLPEAEIASMLRQAVARAAPIARAFLTPLVHGAAVVTVSPDKLKAVLFLRKGRGGGKHLLPAAVSEAIRASKVKGFNPETVRRDLLAFFAGKNAELSDYVLVTGRPPKQGKESKIEWRALFLPAEEAAAIRATANANAEGLKSIASLSAFPLARVEAVARVKPDAEVLRITGGAGAEPGVNVFGAAIPPGKGSGADVRLFEGVALRKDVVVATEPGILEKGSDGATILLRVRPHKDAEMRVNVSPDRMKATLSFSPAEGDGTRISVDDARARIRQAGVLKGIKEEKLLAALDSMVRGEPLIDCLIAEGRPPALDIKKRVVFNVHIATGKAVTLRKDGRADFRAQDRITRVNKGELIATVRPRDAASEDGWDVTGAAVTLPTQAQESLQAGRGVREQVQADGSILYTAEAAGELAQDGTVLSVMDMHPIEGDVGMATGNIKFPGNVKISGSVRSGFTVVAAGILEVGEGVEAALLSADGSIIVGLGIKGEGKAILRSKRDILSAFAEQAVLLSIGDVHLRGPCVRCQVKCNGRVLLDSEKGTLVGGEVRASRGAEVQNIGSPGGIRTVVSFGQDFLVKDQIEREEREVAALIKRVADLDAEMFVLERRAAETVAAAGAAAGQSQAAVMLGRARAQKVQAMKLIEQRKLRLITLHDRYDEHVPSEIAVRGTVYPGVVLESHGRRWETRTEKKMITLHFDPTQGRIVEKL
ncbi:MAG: flagellar assembly protein A [Spirochaetia bacterium]|jgi:uncharacterized protein (DUF342 family)